MTKLANMPKTQSLLSNTKNHFKCLELIILLSIFFTSLGSKLDASVNFATENSCELVASEAEKAFNLPNGILASIARVESGRKTQDGLYKAWPWTINDNGKGLFFDERDAAIKYIKRQVELNNIAIDIGCMQISVKWHGQAFSSQESMLDPHTNIAYAAIFLEELYQTHGDWELAIKHYHSADAEKNIPYLQKVNAIWKGQPEPNVNPSTASASYVFAEQSDNEAYFKEDINNRSKQIIENTSTSNKIEPIMPVIQMGSTIGEETSSLPSTEYSQKNGYNRPSLKFTNTQPYLAGEWEKVTHFRELFAKE